MPNWCQNELYVWGEIEELRNFVGAMKGKRPVYSDCMGDPESESYGYTMHALVPVPDDVLAAGYSEAGYNWCLENWGTKWDIREMLEEYDWDIEFWNDTEPEDHVEFIASFESAWGPPDKFFKKVAPMFEKLSFLLLYSEPGNDVSGYLYWDAGRLVDENQDDYEAYDRFLEKTELIAIRHTA